MNSIYIDDIEQGTPEWHALRLGIPTASCFDRIVTPAKGELSTQSSAYLHELLAEWLSGASGASFSSPWTERGTDLEPEARAYYAFERDTDVHQVGFVFADSTRMVGCSPDGIVGDDGLLEFKCPKPATHIGYLLAGKLPTTYRAQVQGSLMVTERLWCDFVSYCPGLPPLIVRVERDTDYIAKLRAGLKTFIERLHEGRAALAAKGYAPLREAA